LVTVAFFELGLAFYGVSGEGQGFESFLGDGFTGHFANSVGSKFDSFEGLIDFVEGILFLGEDAEGEVSVVGVAACIGLVHSEGTGFASFGTGAEAIACNSLHCVEEVIFEG